MGNCYSLGQNICKSKRYDKIKITQFGIASGCDEDSFWYSFTKGTSTYTYRFTDISENTIKIQLIVTGTVALYLDYNYGSLIYNLDAYYTPETYKSVIESIINGYVNFVLIKESKGVLGNRYIFTAFDSRNHFETSFTAIAPAGKNYVEDYEITFTQDNIVVKAVN